MLLIIPRVFSTDSQYHLVFDAISVADSLKYTSALSVLLALVFVVITAGIAIMRMINGSIGMPKLMPEIVDQASFWKLFTTVPVLVTAYICHHNSKCVI